MLEEPPKTHERLHVEVVSTSSRMGLLHPKVKLDCNYHNDCFIPLTADIQLIMLLV